MKKIGMLGLSLAFILFTLAACNTGNADSAKTYTDAKETAKAEDTANAADNENSPKVYGKGDTNITAKTGETFTIKLDQNITTGYAWTYTVADETIIKNIKDDYITQETDKNIVGAGGTRALAFKALKAGKTTITLVYERSFDKKPDDEKIVYNVNVE